MALSSELVPLAFDARRAAATLPIRLLTPLDAAEENVRCDTLFLPVFRNVALKSFENANFELHASSSATMLHNCPKTLPRMILKI